MIAKKPTIILYVYIPDSDLLREIVLGIEEEGLLYEIIEKKHESAKFLADLAAKESMLGSGIGICKTKVVFTMDLLGKYPPIEEYEHPNLHIARNLGGNSARAVKRNPFRWINENEKAK